MDVLELASQVALEADALLRCSRCGASKPPDAFARQRSRKRRKGRSAWCRECDKAAKAARPRYEPAMAGEQECYGCEEMLPYTAYPVAAANRPTARYPLAGRTHRCRACEKDARYVRQYGMTYAEFERVIAEQGGVCAICDEEFDGHGPNADHDHQTGKFRGALCSGCNAKLGWYENRRKRINKYLKRGK